MDEEFERKNERSIFPYFSIKQESGVLEQSMLIVHSPPKLVVYFWAKAASLVLEELDIRGVERLETL